MNIALWVIQALAALAFIASGFMKVVTPVEKLKERMGFVKHTAPVLVRLLGIVEVLGGIGLIVPAATDKLPWLTPTAAICLAIIMIGATVVHIRMKESPMAPIILLILLLIIIVGRFAIAPIS